MKERNLYMDRNTGLTNYNKNFYITWQQRDSNPQTRKQTLNHLAKIRYVNYVLIMIS